MKRPNKNGKQQARRDMALFRLARRYDGIILCRPGTSGRRKEYWDKSLYQMGEEINTLISRLRDYPRVWSKGVHRV